MNHSIFKIIIPFIFISLVAAGCGNYQVVVDMDKEQAKQKDIQEQLDNFSCFEFCNYDMLTICPSYEPSTCQKDCESKWPDTIRECMLTADDCNQISQDEPYCEDKVDKDLMPKAEVETVAEGCPGACLQYKKCAGYGDDITAEDMEYAYESCMETCSTWSPETISCVRSNPISNPADCAVMTACALKEMNKYLQ
ncbi:hypothetical protein KKG46_01765 [Patescibacteria group bacterium]|nr:hypothetical protein [Patescibacteria group bacterium]